MRPRIWLVPYLRNWSYDLTARALVRHLSHRFEFRIAYQEAVDGGDLAAWDADAVVDFWWHGNLQRTYRERCITQISSHRWAQRKWGKLRPSNLIERYAMHAGAVVVPSRRLHLLLSTERPGIHIAPKGFDPALFADHGVRRGPIAVGWAGASVSKDKHVDVLLAAEPDARLADQCLVQSEMGDFYNSVDVIACSSEAEGDPRPLIEGMASGCFPVTTDVGIAPELVLSGENGLVVDRTPEAFAAAFRWCRENAQAVRAAGRRNAAAMRQARSWEHVSPAWGDVIDRVLGISRAASDGATAGTMPPSSS